MLKGMKIRSKILFAVLSVLVLSLLSMAVITYVNIVNITGHSETVMGGMAEDAVSRTEDALIAQAHSFLAVVANEQSKMANAVLENISLNVRLIEGAVLDIYANPDRFNGREIVRPRDAIEGEYNNTWLLADKHEVTDEILLEVELLSNLVVVMPVLAQDPNILELYVGTERGIFYNYTQMIFENTEFDPRLRPWYIDAVQRPDDVIFTEVYEDAFGTGMVLTAAKAIIGEDGNLIGVAALDIQLDALKELVLSTRVVDTGYVFIIDKYGSYIVHPEMGSDGFAHFQDDEDVVFADGLRRMINGEQGFEEEETEDGVMYLAFSPLSVADWTVGVIVPENEIISSKESLSIHMGEIIEKASEDMGLMFGILLRELAVALAISVIIILFIGILISRVISRPIQELSKGVALFGGGKLENRIEIKSKDEIGALAGIFNQMADNIVKNMEEIEEAATERERLNGELRIAAQIQNDMLPNVSEKLANVSCLDVYASVEAALEMGGDLYDVFFVDEDRHKLCEVVADVSGKGMPAAMFMVMTKTLIRNYMFSGYSPAESLRKANNRLCEDNPTNMFVTIVVSITDLETGECRYAQAGHNPVAYCAAGGEFRFIETERTTPLGFFPDNEYPLQSAVLNPGDKRFQYTDGITEALDENDAEWGEDALLAVLNENRHMSCSEIAVKVRQAIADHRGSAEQSDDITMLVTEYTAFGGRLR